jgi:hypothetical protein
MMILSIYLDSLQKNKSDVRLTSLTCNMLLFLAVPTFKHAIFRSDLLAVPFTFCLSYFLGVKLLFLACLYLAMLFLAGRGAILLFPMSKRGLSKWKLFRVPHGNHSNFFFGEELAVLHLQLFLLLQHQWLFEVVFPFLLELLNKPSKMTTILFETTLKKLYKSPMGFHRNGSAFSVINPTRALTQERRHTFCMKGGSGVDVSSATADQNERVQYAQRLNKKRYQLAGSNTPAPSSEPSITHEARKRKAMWAQKKSSKAPTVTQDSRLVQMLYAQGREEAETRGKHFFQSTIHC